MIRVYKLEGVVRNNTISTLRTTPLILYAISMIFDNSSFFTTKARRSSPSSMALLSVISFEVGMTLNKAMEDSEDSRAFVNENDEVEIMDMAYKLEGVVRNVGRHAGGVVIAPSSLTDFVPLYTEEAGSGLSVSVRQG